MNNFLQRRLLLLGVCLLAWSTRVQAQFSGSGASNDPYQIANYNDLDTLARRVNRGISYTGTYFKLTANIDCSGHGYWTPIGTDANPFQGNFNGNGKWISGLKVNAGNYVGLFGKIVDGKVEKVGVILAPEGIRGMQYVGGLAGYVSSSSGTGADISECYVIGNVRGNSEVGGLIGKYIASIGSRSVEFCYTSGSVNGSTSVGGLVGANGTSASATELGGTVQNCYSTMQVKGNQNVGGLVGNNCHRIDYSYTITPILSQGSNVGSVVGNNNSGGNTAFQSVFFDTAMTQNVNSADGNNGFSNIISLTSTDRFFLYTYTSKSWDFSNIWAIRVSQSYPYFLWQSAPVSVNVAYSDSINLDIKNVADSIVVYKGAGLQRVCVLKPITTGDYKPFTTEILNKINAGDTLYFITWEMDKAPSSPVRAVVSKYPITIGAACADTSIIYGNITTNQTIPRYKIVSGKLRNGHSLTACTMTLNVPGSSMTGSYPNAGRKYAFSFYGTQIKSGGTDVTGSYNITYRYDSAMIAKRPLYVVPNSGQYKIYGTSDPEITYQIANIQNAAQGESFSVNSFNGALSRASGETAGTYLITSGNLAVNDNYRIVTDTILQSDVPVRNPVFFEIRKKNTTAADFGLNPTSFTYNGSSQIPSVVESGTTTNASVSNVKYYDSNNNPVAAPTNAGVYRIVCDIAAGTNYNALPNADIGTFTINKKQVELSDLENSSGTACRTFNNKPQRAVIIQKSPVGGVSRTGMGVITVHYQSTGLSNDTMPPVNAGTYPVKVSVSEGSNYFATSANINMNFNICIDKANPTANDTSLFDFSPKRVLYDGQQHSVTVTSKGNGVGNFSNLKYNNNATAPTDVDNYTITIDVAAGNNYNAASDLEIGGIFRISPPFTAELVQGNGQNGISDGILTYDSMQYTGRQLRPAVRVSCNVVWSGCPSGNCVLNAGTDYTLTYGTNKEVATGGSVIITGIRDYDGNGDTLFFKIVPKRDNITGIDSLVIKDITVGDDSTSVIESLNKANNEATYRLPCGANRTTITINTENHNATIIYEGNKLTSRSFTIEILDYGTKKTKFTVISTDGTDSVTYFLNIIKPIPFDAIVVTRWNSHMTVINNPKNNLGGFNFRWYNWYEDGKLISQSQSIPDAYSSYKINPDATYSVTLITTTDDSVHSCHGRPAMTAALMNESAAVKIYPNPIAGERVVWVELEGNVSPSGESIAIYDIDGKLQRIQKTKDNLTAVPMPMETGAYIVRVKETTKIIVVR